MQSRPEARSLREAQNRLDSALAAGTTAIWTWDIVNDPAVTDASLACLFSIPLDETTGEKLESYARFIHPDDREHVANLIQESMDSGNDFHAEYRVIQQDGRIRWIEGRGKVERHRAGKASTLPGVITDITDRKRIEQDRQRLFEQLQEHDTQKNNFLAMLAHELRNPLASISNSVIVMSCSEDKNDRDESTQIIQRQTHHLSR